MTAPESFCAFILTHGRPDKVRTYQTLRSSGYTGPIRLLIDDLDKTRDEYVKRYVGEVVIFDKKAVAKTFDTGDNFDDMRAICYARNACFDVARRLGFTYFIQLDDDYTNFGYRFDQNLQYFPKKISNLDAVFGHILRYFIESNATSIAFSQGGDFIGGENLIGDKGNPNTIIIRLLRKCMNSFFCSVDRQFKFIGRINEDVNTYVRSASTGLLFLTMNQISLTQVQSQQSSGGMTELYLDSGTYLKSFYTVMYHPSSFGDRIRDAGR